MKVIKKISSILLILAVLSSSYFPLFQYKGKSPFVSEVSAQEACSAGIGDLRNYLSTRVGGVSLDEAAVFLADMSDITGAYYDADQDRIVFVGTKGSTSVPKFDKDDLAVAIRALVFNNQIPAVSMDFKDPNNMFGDPNMNVLYYGGIEDTKFGQVMVDADYKMKQYAHGYDVNGQKIVSSVPGYKSHFDRFLEKNPDPSKSSYSRWWITPKLVSLKKDDSAKSFIFDQVQMQIETEGLWSTNDPKWNEAAVEFAQQQTDLYDQFAQETPSYYQAKQLAKIVGVVKWIKDNNIVNNFEWARDYQPKYVATPREIKRLTTPDRQVGNTIWRMTGGVIYDEPNLYSPDGTQISTGLKNSSESIGTPTEENHWTFTNGGITYEAVAVAANAFRSVGGYSTSSVDMSFPTVGEIPLSFTRDYSSFSGGQKGIGRGWDFLPARLVDNNSGWYVNCTSGALGKHTWKLLLTTLDGINETFTYTSCSTGYSADKPEYHSKIAHNSDGTFTVTLKNQTKYTFSSDFRLLSASDKNGNVQTYSYNSSGKVNSIQDGQGHILSLSYNSQGLMSQVADWTGRKVQYGYDAQGNLTSVTDPKGGITRYQYDLNNKLSKIINRLGQTVVENTYTPESKLASQKDVNGVVVNFTYDEAARTVNAVDSQARSGKLVYDTKARVVESRDALNYPIAYTYGNEFSPLTVTDKKGYKTTYTYDSNGNTTSMTLPIGKKITYQYNSSNFISKILDGRYGSSTKNTTFSYDAKNNPTQIDEAGRIVKYAYDQFGGTASFTDPSNKKTTYTRNNFGQPLMVVDPLGNSTTYEYDSLARIVKLTDSEGKNQTSSYDVNNNLLSTNDGLGIHSFVYDAENRLTKSTTPTNAVTEYGYNASGNLTSIKDALLSTTSYVYDGYSNLISQTSALNQTTTHEYNVLNQKTKSTTPLAKATNWEYDQNGNITKRTDANGKQVTYTYDNLNRLTKIIYPDSTSVTYTYDNRSNLTKVTNQNGSTTFTYDIFDRLTKVTNPNGRSISYTFDSSDNITKITYPDNKSVNYTYDANNRMNTIADWNGNSTSYAYLTNGLLSTKTLTNGIKGTYTYDIAGRLIGITYDKNNDTLAKFSYQRNNQGDITRSTEEGAFFETLTPTPTPISTPNPTPTPVVATPTPTPTGSLPTPTPTPTSIPAPTPTGTGGTAKPDLVVTNITLSNPNPTAGDNFDITATVKNIGTATAGGILTYMKEGFYYDLVSEPTTSTSYDDTENYLGSILPGQSITVTETLTDFATSGPHNIWVLADRTGAVSESNEFNNALRLDLSVALGETVFRRIANLSPLPFVKNLFIPKKAYAQTVLPQYITTYSYDPLSRITSASYSDKTYSYTYDKIDNRLTQTVSGATTSYSYNSDSQLTQYGTTTVGYDNNGNTISKTAAAGNKTFIYDLEDRLTSYASGTTTTYQYDGLGERIQKTTGSTTTRYVSDISQELSRVLVETNSSNTIYNWYLYGLDLISQGSSGASSRLYPLSDGLGNIRFVTNYAGSEVKRYDYDPFGNVRFSSGANSINYEFESQQLDPESGMYYLRARYYDPETGRFITKDPINGDLDRPQTQNPYTYALDNPNTYSDPTGKTADNYTIYGGFDAFGAIRYVGITCRDIAMRAGEHLNSLDPIRSSLTYKPLHIVGDLLTARGSEQAYIDAYGMVKEGGQLVNKINSISPNNPVLSQGQNQAQSAGAVPAIAAAAPSALSTIGGVAAALIKVPVIMIVAPYQETQSKPIQM